LLGVFATHAVNDVGHGQPLGLVDGHAGQVLVQLYGVLAVAAFSAAVTWGLLRIVDATIGLRVTREEETDTVLHGERVQ
jgi:ammonium transporter, Amt family